MTSIAKPGPVHESGLANAVSCCCHKQSRVLPCCRAAVLPCVPPAVPRSSAVPQFRSSAVPQFRSSAVPQFRLAPLAPSNFSPKSNPPFARNRAGTTAKYAKYANDNLLLKTVSFTEPVKSVPALPNHSSHLVFAWLAYFAVQLNYGFQVHGSPTCPAARRCAGRSSPSTMRAKRSRVAWRKSWCRKVNLTGEQTIQINGVTVEGEAAFGWGFDGSISCVIDTINPLRSGIYGAWGQGIGVSIGVGIGGVYGHDSIAGLADNIDGNFKAFSGTYSCEPKCPGKPLGGALTLLGPGVGGMVSETNTKPWVTWGDILEWIHRATPRWR